MSDQDSCPFKVGDRVIYRPSQRGWGLGVMSEQLVREQEYRIVEIQKQNYIVVEGYSYPGGGLYWTEFVAATS